VCDCFQILRNNASSNDKEQFMKEAEVMLELDDPTLVRMVGVAVQQQPCLVVLEFMPFGDLLRVIKALLSGTIHKNKKIHVLIRFFYGPQTCKEKDVQLTTAEMLDMSRQVCAGCAFIHAKVLFF
jgi:serine/threonine protein kinase